MRKNKVWFITGASKGMGLAIAKYLLANGYLVAATSRNKNELIKVLGEESVNFLPLQINVVQEQEVKSAITKTVAVFGEVDMLVNNAGFGQMGIIEELSDAEARYCFDINVFGLLNVLRNGISYLRQQGHGHIFNFSSIAGYSGTAGSGVYSATKFAVDGLSDSLSKELAEFGVKVTSVKFGKFRTEFLGESLRNPINRIHAYGHAREEQQQRLSNFNHKQPGDPEKIAPVLIEIADSENPPVNLFLGKDAYKVASDKIDSIQYDLKQWKHLTLATDYEEGR